jgi:hypothetical protein
MAGRQQPMFDAKLAEDGITVANREPFLNILGAPGAGKSTFLRRLGLESMLARTPAERVEKRLTRLSSKYEHARLPVYIELRAFRTKPIDLIGLITEEFATCKFPKSRDFVEAALDSGQLLVLLDGLDEVPGEKLGEVVDHVRDFVDRYGEQGETGNRFVTSCRTAHYKNAFPRFTDVVLADLSDEQIEQFATNWFSGFHDKQTDAAEKFFGTLKEPANQSVQELARTPLLLTFLCLTYEKDQVLPRVRAALYKRALDLLLREWVAERRVHNEPIYQELNADLELDMLAEFAEPLFRDDRFFFTRGQVTDHIRTFLSNQLNAPKTLDAEKILEAIEIQQGLIVRRAQDTYSFSHLTIQEYLTAKQLWHDPNRPWEAVVQKHLFDYRWTVVFELMAGMGKSDELFQAMAASARRQLDDVILHSRSIAHIMQWVIANAQVDPEATAENEALGRLILLAVATLLAPKLVEKGHDASGGVEAFFSAKWLALALGNSSRLEDAFRHPNTDGMYSHWGEKDHGNYILARGLLNWLLQEKIALNNRDAFIAASDYLNGDKPKAQDVCRMLGLRERENDSGLGQVGLHVDVYRIMFRCRTAAYRLTPQTWDEVCRSILQPSAKRSR